MKTLVLLPLALLSTAAMAQDYPPPPPPHDQTRDAPPYDRPDDSRRDTRDYAARPPIDPATAVAVAGAVRAVTDAILDVRIDGVRRAADPSARDDGSRTIGDLMARRDPNYREHLHQDMTRAARTAAGAARSAGAVKAAADEFARRVENALAGVEGY